MASSEHREQAVVVSEADLQTLLLRLAQEVADRRALKIHWDHVLVVEVDGEYEATMYYFDDDDGCHRFNGYRMRATPSPKPGNGRKI